MPLRFVVLIHGSYHQPAHYRPLIERLEAEGVTVLAPDIGMLPLPESTRRVQAVVDGCASPPTVVAHSFGGAVAVALTNTRATVFLSAFVLDPGESANQALAEAAETDPDGGREFMAALRWSDDGAVATIDPEAATSLFYADCAPDDAAAAVTLLRPDITANFDLAPAADPWRRVPSLYLRTLQDHAWPTPLVDRYAGRCTKVATLDTSHSPFLSRPDETAAVITAFL